MAITNLLMKAIVGNNKNQLYLWPTYLNLLGHNIFYTDPPRAADAVRRVNKNMKVSVIVHPNSKRPRIEKDLFGTLHIYVHEPPLEGRANRAVIEALTLYFEVKKSNVQLLSGLTSKHKRLEILSKS